VDVIAVGTGQALSIAGRGDADVVIVHAREQEEAFIAAGHAKQRHEIMVNDFVVIGPKDDPAQAVRASSAAEAFRAIAAARATFFSRATRAARTARNSPSGPPPDSHPAGRAVVPVRWVRAAARSCWPRTSRRAYTLTDRGTWLALRAKLPESASRLRGRASGGESGCQR
jgi:tungstate transport system substrate-binding protein